MSALALLATLVLTTDWSFDKILRITQDSSPNACGYILNTTDKSSVSSFIELNRKCPYMITTGDKMASSIYKMETIVIFVDELGQVEGAGDLILTCGIWEQKSELYFVVRHSDNDLREQLEDLMQRLWVKKLINYVIVVAEGQYTYNPFTRDKVLRLRENGGLSMFRNKMDDLQGFTFRVSMFKDGPRTIKYNGEWYGKDYTLLNIMSDIFNATFEIKEPDGDVKDFYTAAEDLINNKTDFCFIRRFYMQLSDEGFDYSYPLEMESIVAMVPRAGQRPRISNIVRIFDMRVYGFMVLMFVLVAIASKMARNCDLLQIYGMSLLQPFNRFEHYTSINRFILVFWIYQTLILSTAFQGSLIEQLLNPKFFEDIDTIADLAKSDLPIYTTSRQSHILPQILQNKVKFFKRDEIFEMLFDFNTSGVHVLPITFAMAYFSALERTHERGYQSPFHVMREVLIPGYSSYNFQRNSPFMDKFYESLLREKQYGLSRAKKILPGSVYGKYNNTVDEMDVPFSMEHLQGVFYFLGAGCALSSLVFLVEVIRYRKQG